ncbi:hypothetical protein ACJX0J_040531 [Zea mays]
MHKNAMFYNATESLHIWKHLAYNKDISSILGDYLFLLIYPVVTANHWSEYMKKSQKGAHDKFQLSLPATHGSKLVMGNILSPFMQPSTVEFSFELRYFFPR